MRLSLVVRHFISCAGLLSACSASDVSVPTTASSAPANSSACDENLDTQVLRAGHAGKAALLYDCADEACSGDERFARGVEHAISLEVTAPAESALILESADPTRADVANVATAFDPCAGKMRIWATLKAEQNGATRLVVRDALTTLDHIDLVVADPHYIRLRATRTGAFAFEQAKDLIQGTAGESWLISPELFDAQRILIVGSPPLTWEVDDPHVLELLSHPEGSEPTAIAALTTATLQAKSAGQARLRVQAASGAQASVQFQVTARDL